MCYIFPVCEKNYPLECVLSDEKIWKGINGPYFLFRVLECKIDPLDAKWGFFGQKIPGGMFSKNNRRKNFSYNRKELPKENKMTVKDVFAWGFKAVIAMIMIKMLFVIAAGLFI